jgi:hypothetical protein
MRGRSVTTCDDAMPAPVPSCTWPSAAAWCGQMDAMALTLNHSPVQLQPDIAYSCHPRSFSREVCTLLTQASSYVELP